MDIYSNGCSFHVIVEKQAFRSLSRTIDYRDMKSEEDYDREIWRYSTALKTLSSCLKKYHGENVIILLDEYDVLLENAYYNGFYDEMVGFIRSLFESCLKTNDALEFAVVTGCLRISKESIFTGLNHLKINSIRDENFAEGFGFTEEETEKMLCDYGMEDRIPEAKDWYNGYVFGKEEIYNPWSVINYVDAIANNGRQFPEVYWSNTSSNQIIKDMVWQVDVYSSYVQTTKTTKKYNNKIYAKAADIKNYASFASNFIPGKVSWIASTLFGIDSDQFAPWFNNGYQKLEENSTVYYKDAYYKEGKMYWIGYVASKEAIAGVASYYYKDNNRAPHMDSHSYNKTFVSKSYNKSDAEIVKMAKKHYNTGWVNEDISYSNIKLNKGDSNIMKMFNPKVKRIRRTYFWVAWILCRIITGTGIYVTLMELAPLDETFSLGWGLLILFSLIDIVCFSLLTIKRYHDAGYGTGYAVLSLLLVPFVIGAFLIFHVAVMESEPDNEWGPNTERLEYEKNRDFYAR